MACKLNGLQKSFIRRVYRKSNGCYLTIAREFIAKFNRQCPKYENIIDLLEDKDESVTLDERVIKDAILSQCNDDIFLDVVDEGILPSSTRTTAFKSVRRLSTGYTLIILVTILYMSLRTMYYLILLSSFKGNIRV